MKTGNDESELFKNIAFIVLSKITLYAAATIALFLIFALASVA